MPLLNVIDAGITLRILKLLVTPWTMTPAFRLGIIDRNGQPLKKSSDLKTPQEQKAYTMLDRLVFKLKRVLQNIPIVNRNLTNLAAAMWLVKEEYNRDSPTEIESLKERFSEILDGEDSVLAEKQFILKHLGELSPIASWAIPYLNEDGGSGGGAPIGGPTPPVENIANNAGSGGVAGFRGDAGVKSKLMKRPLRRKRPGAPQQEPVDSANYGISTK